MRGPAIACKFSELKKRKDTYLNKTVPCRRYMAIARLLLLFVGVAAQQYAVTPPNIRPPTEQRREQHGAEHSLPLIINSIKVRQCNDT